MLRLSQFVSSPVGAFIILALAAYLEVQGALLLRCPACSETAISSIAQQAYLRRRSFIAIGGLIMTFWKA
jgi:hypothetical protein